MDSGNEVIIVDDSIATTNGLNGNHEDLNEMKTRSKGTDGPDEASKAKLRSTRSTNAKNEEKAGSDSEKKEKKMNLRSADPQDEKEKTGKSTTTSDKPAAKKTATEEKATPLKKKPEREDDSGINSRSSSVSNEDTYSSRMRTRSKTAEALSSSTPASTKKGASRLPLSTYDFDEDISFDDDPSSGSLKRKAVLYVEEMEEFDENPEPPAKRSFILPCTNFVSSLLNPLRAIRGKMSVGSQTEKSGSGVKDDAASQTHVSKVNDDDPEKENVASQTENCVQSVDQKYDNTCRIM